MIRIELTPRLIRTARGLSPEVKAKAEAAIADVAAAFGDPHAHRGLGLRKLARRSYEVRVWLQWRVVFIHDGDTLTAYDIMTHEEVQRWLRGQRK